MTTMRRWASWAFLVAALGVGFGFVGVVLALAHASWLRLPAGIEPKEYVTVGRRNADTGALDTLSVPDYRNFAAAMPGEWAFAHRTTQDLSAQTQDGPLRKVQVRDVSTNFFSLLGVEPALGELFAPSRGVVISHGLWRRWYDGAEDVVGTAFELAGELPRTIVGVASAEFADVFASGAEPADAWTLNDGAGYVPRLSARLSPRDKLVFGTFDQSDGMASLEALAADFDFARRAPIGPLSWTHLAIADGDRLQGARGLEAHPARRDEAQRRLAWLAIATMVMLLLVFLSLVDSLAATEEARQREQAVRIAVGAAPRHLFVEALLANGLWLVPIAAVAALTFGRAASLLAAIEPFATHPGSIPAGSKIVGLGAGCVLLVAAFAGAIAWMAYSVSRMSGTVQSAAGLSGHRAVQRALACVTAVSLLVVASLTGRYLLDSRQSLGFHSDVVAVNPTKRHGVVLSNAESQALGEALAADPAVRAAARAEMAPLISQRAVATTRVQVRAPGVLPGRLADARVYRNAVEASYFDAVGVDFLAGSPFKDGASEAVVSLALAQLLADDPSDILGRTLGVEPVSEVRGATSSRRKRGGVFTIVGVARDLPYLEYDAAPLPIVYQPIEHKDVYGRHVIGFDGGEGAVEELLRALLPELDVIYATPLQRAFNEQFAERRSVELVLACSAFFTLVLGVAGIWASRRRAVAEARASIGIRFSFGATRWDAARQPLRAAAMDVLAAALLIVAIDLAVAALAPRAATFDLWLAAPALALVFLLCALPGYAAIRELARRPLSELVAG